MMSCYDFTLQWNTHIWFEFVVRSVLLSNFFIKSLILNPIVLDKFDLYQISRWVDVILKFAESWLVSFCTD